VEYPAGYGKLIVSWDLVTGAVYYDLYDGTENAFDAAAFSQRTTDTSLTVDDLLDFSPHYFWIKAGNASGTGSPSPVGTGSPGVNVTGITLDQPGVTIPIGSTFQLNATVSPAGATYPTVTWKSDDLSIATVSASGLVTAKGPGSVTITATSTATAQDLKSMSAKCTVNVPSEGPVPPDAPVLKTASTAWGGEVLLSWDASPGASSYNIYYSISSGAGTAGTKDSGIYDTSRTLSGLTNWSKYYFVVTAVGPGGESAISNQLACMPVRQEIIVVNNETDSIDFNLFNATARTVMRPSGHESILGPNGAAADGAASVAIDPEARNAIYVAYTGTTTTSDPGCYKYGYDAANGYATATPCKQYGDGLGPEHLVVVTRPSGKKSLYIAFKADNHIVMYDIDASGNLSYSYTHEDARGNPARYLCADPSGKFLFASNFNAKDNASVITSYAIDSATGILTEVGCVSSGGINPYRSVVTPDGKYLLVTNYGSGNVVSFAISTSGALTQRSSISMSGEVPTGIAIDAAGTNVYVCSRAASSPSSTKGRLERFAFGAGTFTQGESVDTLYYPQDVALDATGTCAIVVNTSTTAGGSDGGAVVYQVDPGTGVISGAATSSFITGSGPVDLLVVKLP